MIQPVSGECCDDPCARSGPCEPCEGCPSTMCVIDKRYSASKNYSGLYYEDGTYLGSPAYRQSFFTWAWRDWTNYPDDGWWTFSTAKGSLTDSVRQTSTSAGGDACPTSTSSMWTVPFDGGFITSGSCQSLCVTGAVDGSGSWQTAACTNGTYVPSGGGIPSYGNRITYQKIIPSGTADCYPTGYYLVWYSTLDNAWHDPGWRLSTTGAPDGFGGGMQYEGPDTLYPWGGSWTTISVAEGTC